jgi:hypothetical protein
MTKAEEIYHRFVQYEWNEIGEGMKKSILDAINEALRQPPVISSVCTCRNAELEKDSLVPVYCHNCNAYVKTDL